MPTCDQRTPRGDHRKRAPTSIALDKAGKAGKADKAHTLHMRYLVCDFLAGDFDAHEGATNEEVVAVLQLHLVSNAQVRSVA